MALPRRTGRSRVTLGLLILTSIAVLTLDFRDTGVVEGARDVVGAVFSPLRGVADTVSSPFRNGWDGITKYDDVRDENDRLRARIEELEGDRTVDAGAAEELDALLEQQGIDWVGDVPRTAARVISGPISNFSHSIEIDKGSSDGIAVDMPVVSGAGLVGRVQQVTSSHAVVQLLTDPDFRVGVRSADGLLGVARGGGAGNPLVVDTGLDAEQEVEPGGALTTSGAERSRYPSSIPVGDVRDTREADGGLTLDLLVEPFVDTQRLTFVSVLLWEGGG